MLSRVLFNFILVAGLASGSQSALLPPSQDPWYNTAPAQLGSATPGTIARVRTAPGNLSSIVANASAAHQILFYTTDGRDQPSWAVTTLLVPQTPAALAQTALLSYQIPYDSASVDVSPSYALNTWALYGDALPINVDIETALGEGWYVSVPDYEGPLASFTNGVQAGHATLDSVRAVLASNLLGANLTASSTGSNSSNSADASVRYALWGYSGGAIASEWAAELQATYAPDLHFGGVAVGGVPTDIIGILRNCSGQACTSFFPAALVGITSQFPDVRAYLVSSLKTTGPYNATTFLSVANVTVADSGTDFSYQNTSLYFIDGEDGFFENGVGLQEVINETARMGRRGTPQMPLYWYDGVEDEIIPIIATDALVAKYCDAGTSIEYVRLATGGHDDDFSNGRPGALEFLSKVFGGTYQASGCSVTTI